MKARTYLVSLLGSAGSASVPQQRDAPDACGCSEQNASSFSLTYGVPLLGFEVGVKTSLKDTPINELATTTVISDPSATAVVSPNVDTWYLSLGFDLSQQDIEITVPVIEDRFFSVSFYDPFGENYVTFGAQDGDVAGTYLLTPANCSSNVGALEGTSNAYKGVVYSPSTQGALLARLLMKDQSETDILYRIADGFSTTMVDRSSGPIGPTLMSNEELFQNNSESQAAHILNMTAWIQQTLPHLEDDIPIIPPSTTRLLEEAGVTDGNYKPVSGVNTNTALAISALSIGSFMADEGQDVGNKWLLSPAIGTYGTDYRARASVASWGYLALTPDVALYPTYAEDFQLAANESFILTFSGKPPLRNLGFWSLTMYDENGYLVPNVLNRYSVSDRSNLTFADGSIVYDSDRDGPFEVLVQAEQPPEKWMSNWLPSPSDGQGLNLILRFYYAEEALSNHTYEYPKVRTSTRQ